MRKRKTGLHRKVSSIFDGISVPKADNAPGQSTDGWTGPAKGREYVKDETDFMPKDARIGPKPAERSPEKARKPIGGPGLLGQPGFDPFGPIPLVSKKRRKVTMVSMVVLFILLIVVLTWTFSQKIADKKTQSASKQAAAAGVAAAQIDTQIDWEIPPEYPETLRDPMENTWRQDPSTGKWVEETIVVIDDSGAEQQQQSLIDVGIALRSILWAETGRSIVVGDEILYEGDTIFGVTIKKINKDSVEFEKDGVGFLKVFPR
jgi:hypothetical protein